MKTKHEIRMMFRDTHDIRIPAGTRVHWVNGNGGGYIVSPSRVEVLSKTKALFKHDATYYYIWVNTDDVEKG